MGEGEGGPGDEREAESGHHARHRQRTGALLSGVWLRSLIWRVYCGLQGWRRVCDGACVQAPDFSAELLLGGNSCLSVPLPLQPRLPAPQVVPTPQVVNGMEIVH